MVKIGIIGLGDIARKAYLPVISKKNVEIHLCSRNAATLKELAETYRIKHTHENLESLIQSGITAAFVHTATASHYEVVEKLLASNIHVYVDKPVTYDYATTAKLVSLAEQKGRVLMVGFNRRYAPAYRQLTSLPDPNMIIMQKNRKSLPADVRTFIFDDFIHVVDTLLFLIPHPIEKWHVSWKKKDDLLYHVVVQFVFKNGAIAIGIMNRDSGTLEEKLELFTPTEKRIVYDLTETAVRRAKSETRDGNNDWTSTLDKRGFESIVDEFLGIVATGLPRLQDQADVLLTHKVCEEIVEKLQS